MENNIDTQLQLAITTDMTEYDDSEELFTGFNPANEQWSLLIRYVGDISDLVERFLTGIYYLLAEYAIITIPQNVILEFALDPRIIYIEKPKTLHQQVSYPAYASCIYGSFLNEYDLTGEGVYLSVIDSGIDYRHEEFLYQGNSRIEELWDQTASYSPDNGNIYGIGRIYNNEEINEALRNPNVNIAGDVSGHGTEVAGIAAGSSIGVAPQSRLLVVKLGGGSSDTFPNTLGLIMGIDYSIRKSRETGIPIVINISFGNNYGPHTGESLLENYIDDVSVLGRCSIVTGTGNDGITGRHVQGMLGNVSYQMIEFVVEDFVRSFNIQIWKNYQDRFDVLVAAPNGEYVLSLNENQQMMRATYKKTGLSSIYGRPNPYNRNQEIFISFFGRTDYVNSGLWRLLIYPKSIINGNYNVYLPVKSSTTGNVQFLNPTEYGTLTTPSTAEGLISVAAYDQNIDDYAYFSGRGYTANNRLKPDIAAPGVDIYTSYPGNIYTFASGTSMAAPFVSGAAALLMEWGLVRGNDPFLYGEKMKASLIRGARKISATNEYPNIYVGWGALCVANVLD